MFEFAMTKYLTDKTYLVKHDDGKYVVAIIPNGVKDCTPIFYREYNNFNDAKETFLLLSNM